jgi:hypothetical protein
VPAVRPGMEKNRLIQVFLSSRNKGARRLAHCLCLLCASLVTMSIPQVGSLRVGGATDHRIHDVATNLEDYPNARVPRHEKLEITFQVDTAAQNLQLPYDAAPLPGVEPEFGITVDGLFTPDDWQTVFTQPAFYYQEFDDQVKSGREWFYPTGDFSWKVRFAPQQTGTWQFKLRAQDASGLTETEPQSFTVVTSDNKGFVRVSEQDPRYFEFDDGTYFPALGYNMNYDHVSWTNPVLDNEQNFTTMSHNGIRLVRIWLSQWGIYGPSWNPWYSIDPSQHGQYIPYAGLTFDQAASDSELSMRVDAGYNPCMFTGAFKAQPAVKRTTDYRVRIRYKTEGITGPRIAGEPYGFVAKTGGWLWGGENTCYEPGTGTAVTPHQDQNTPDWQILEGTLNTGSNDFLPYFYLVMENVNGGSAYIDTVWIEEDLGDGTYGPNIVSKPSMAHHLYMEQRNSYAFDKLLDLAKEYDIYLRPVIHEKNEWIFNRIDDDGDFTTEASNSHFYGNWRQMTKVRWLQQAWWRYLQARWGYSPNIHSWELLNEGDPWNSQHYTLADELGRTMHQFAPSDHLVSTSNWHSFPRDDFWANPSYPDVDFADLHRYIVESDSVFTDAAQATYDVSMQYGAKQPGGAGKPVIRGETGFVVSGSEPPTGLFEADTEGIWLHNFIWGGINPGGLIESYWYENTHIYGQGFDHRHHYGTYYSFIEDVPLSNGHYQDAEAVVSDTGLRAWGQKDLVNGRAHLWIQNRAHTWRNVVDGAVIPPISATVTITGLGAGVEHRVEWWDPCEGRTTHVRTVAADPNGSITITVADLTSDVAIKVKVVRGIAFIPIATKKH